MVVLYSQLFVTPPYPTASFEGQTIIVTGSNVGLGKEAARYIARFKASKLILGFRNTAAGEEAKDDIVRSLTTSGVLWLVFSSLFSMTMDNAAPHSNLPPNVFQSTAPLKPGGGEKNRISGA
ncbi:hypothetical protein DV735_g5285, partial [Chaetothyriales sp. CBS 134920]